MNHDRGAAIRIEGREIRFGRFYKHENASQSGKTISRRGAEYAEKTEKTAGVKNQTL